MEEEMEIWDSALFIGAICSVTVDLNRGDGISHINSGTMLYL